MDIKHLTNRDLIEINPGTKVRIKHHVDCDEKYKKGGVLVKQWQSEIEDKQRRFGIQVGDAVCFNFSCNDYEIIDERFMKSKFYLSRMKAKQGSKFMTSG